VGRELLSINICTSGISRVELALIGAQITDLGIGDEAEPLDNLGKVMNVGND
jgi:hypothetical protein